MKNKILLLCSVALALQVTVFSQQSSLALTAGATLPKLWGKQWETSNGPLSFRVSNGGMYGSPANAGKQARLDDVVELHITNTSNAQIYVYLTDPTTNDVVFFDVYDPHIWVAVPMTNIEEGYYNIEIGDYGPNTWKSASPGCESTKSGLVLTWTEAWLGSGCNGFYVSN